MTNVAYSDGTPSATMTHDRAGRLRTVTDAAGTRSLSWTDRDQAGDESYTNGLLAGVTVTRSYDAASRLSTLGLSLGGTPQTRQRFAYDNISWLDYIADETPDGSMELHRFDYAFKTNTPFVESVAFSRSSTSVMTNFYNRDNLGRLAGVNATLAGGASVSGVDYQLDALDRRYQADLADGTKWDYSYNDRSEVTSGKKKLASGALAGGAQFEYGFDDIGNRTKTKAGGDATGATLRESIYTANALNELVSREVPGSVWLSGEAETNLVLQGIANGAPFAVQRQEGERFFGEAQVMNDGAPAFARVTVAGKTNGVLNDVETGNHFVARTPESFTHDDDGNLTQDGRWIYAWDAESRLVSVTARADIPDAAKRKVEFVYDFMGRRVRKVVSVWNGSTYTAQSTNRFVYDGWNLLTILDPQSSILQSFTWGLDLSGSVQGAGGVGGLLAINDSSAHFVCYDGNGNVSALVKASDGSVSANYEYGPFGEAIRASGQMAAANPFTFSTKYQDPESDLAYYGYRFYSPGRGRWLSRDAIEETGGLNLCGFVRNSPLSLIDPVGQRPGPGGANGPVDLYLGLYGTPPTHLSDDLMLQVYNSGTLAAFKESNLLEARLRYKCGEGGVFVTHDFDEKFSLAQGWTARSVRLLFTGNWQLFMQSRCTWHCQPCADCNKCKCRATCAISGVISKTYTFAPVNSNWLVNYPFFSPYLQTTYNISTSFQDVANDISERACR